MGRRYFPDPEQQRVARLKDEEIARARAAEKEGGWITYLVRDPREPDKKGNPAGTPIYVGQSKVFGKRVYSRFNKSEKEATEQGDKTDSIEKRVAGLLHAGWVAPHEVLERTPTHLTSLISETNWARRCVRRGYVLVNRVPFQNCAEPDITRYDIPVEWIWNRFNLEEAIEDQVHLVLGCRNCELILEIPFVQFARADEPPRDLSLIKANGFWRREPCTGCSTRRQRFATLRIA